MVVQYGHSELNRNMKKFFTHWTFAFVTCSLTWIGQGPQVKEILRLKSFDFHLQSTRKTNFTRHWYCNNR